MNNSIIKLKLTSDNIYGLQTKYANESDFIEQMRGILNTALFFGYNTVILTNKNKTVEYHMLLRWKNHAGVLFPAWQIKFKRK